MDCAVAGEVADGIDVEASPPHDIGARRALRENESDADPRPHLVGQRKAADEMAAAELGPCLAPERNVSHWRCLQNTLACRL